jgi:hypothetical protein
MHIVVCVKQTPATENVQIDPETGTLKREGMAAAINPFDEYGIEEAVRIKERVGGDSTVSVITMGPPQAEQALRDAIARGADQGFHICGREFAGADTWATSYAIFKGIQKIEKEFKEAFIKEGLTEELANDMAQIYKRDTYGKGGVVIWSIYSFLESEAPFFRKLNDDEYNEIADRYVTAMNKVFKETSVDSKLMKVSDLKQDSIDFNKFSKNVLTSGNNYEFPIEE